MQEYRSVAAAQKDEEGYCRKQLVSHAWRLYPNVLCVRCGVPTYFTYI
jgi:hypothetical protein